MAFSHAPGDARVVRLAQHEKSSVRVHTTQGHPGATTPSGLTGLFRAARRWTSRALGRIALSYAPGDARDRPPCSARKILSQGTYDSGVIPALLLRHPGASRDLVTKLLHQDSGLRPVRRIGNDGSQGDSGLRTVRRIGRSDASDDGEVNVIPAKAGRWIHISSATPG